MISASRRLEIIGGGLGGGPAVERWEVAPHSVLVDIGPSPINGRGCYAAEEMIAGQIIGMYEGRVCVSSPGKFALQCEAADGGPGYCIDGSGPLKYINHDEDGNTEICGVYVYATKTFPAGTELTLCYGEDIDFT